MSKVAIEPKQEVDIKAKAVRAVKANVRNLRDSLSPGESKVSRDVLLKDITSSKSIPLELKEMFKRDGMSAICLPINGEFALEIIALLNVSNRGIYWNHVEKYAIDMLEGQWKQGGVSIAFDEDNKLSDGQHRLLALAAVSSHVGSIEMPIAIHVDRASKLKQENRKAINGNDILQFLGKDPEFIHKNTSTTIKAIICGNGGHGGMASKLQPEDYSTLFDVLSHAVYRTCVLFEDAKGAGSRLNVAPVRAVVARALHLNWKNPEVVARIERFVTLLKLGGGIDLPAEDTAAIRLYEAYTALVRPPRDAEAVTECYRRTQSALQKFLAKKPAQRYSSVHDQVYKIKEIDKD